MKLLVVSEGKHELNLDGETSALVELLRRLLPSGVSFERRKVSDRALDQVVLLGKSLRHEKVILRWVRYAEREGFDGLALVVDEDGKQDRRRAVESAQQRNAFTIPRAIGLAIRSFDAWMLADETAISKALSRSVDRQSDPEGIRDPKELCRTLLADADGPMSQTDMYIAISKVADLDRLAQRCQRGFAPFRESVVSISESM